MTMDPQAKAAAADEIQKRFSQRIEHLGFRRTTAVFWTRPRDHVVEFIHLHLYSFSQSFHVHFGLRVLNDDVPTVALNGPSSDSPHRGHYNHDFTDDEASYPRCVDELYRFCVEVGEPWFAAHRALKALVSSGDSPLTADARRRLRQSIEGDADIVHVTASKQLLGLV